MPVTSKVLQLPTKKLRVFLGNKTDPNGLWAPGQWLAGSRNTRKYLHDLQRPLRREGKLNKTEIRNRNKGPQLYQRATASDLQAIRHRAALPCFKWAWWKQVFYPLTKRPIDAGLVHGLWLFWLLSQYHLDIRPRQVAGEVNLLDLNSQNSPPTITTLRLEKERGQHYHYCITSGKILLRVAFMPIRSFRGSLWVYTNCIFGLSNQSKKFVRTQ